MMLVVNDVVKLLRLLMSCEVALAASIKVLILCLLTWAAYLVTFSIDTMWTRFSCCDDCVVISWFICVLILFISFVVAVPVSQLRASPRKGSKLLLWQMCVCSCPSKEGLDCNNFIRDNMVVFQSCICPQCLKVLLVVLTLVAFGLMAADPENVVVAVS